MLDIAHKKLKIYGSLPDKDIDLFECAFLLANANKSPEDYMFYQKEFEKMIEDVGKQYQREITRIGEDSAALRLSAIKHVIYEQYSFSAEEENRTEFKTANIVEAWKSRKAMPIILALLCVQSGKVLGWNIHLVKFPAHSICRLEYQGDIVLFDPYRFCKVMQAADLRSVLKEVVGSHAELSADYYQILSNREILIRLENTTKLHQIEKGDYQAAVDTIERMLLVSPQEYRLLFDVGILYAKTHQTQLAIHALKEYVNREPEEKNRQMALIILQEIRENIN